MKILVYLKRSGCFVALYSAAFLAASVLEQNSPSGPLNLLAGFSFAFAALYGWRYVPVIFVAALIPTTDFFTNGWSTLPIVQSLVHVIIYGVSGVRFGEILDRRTGRFTQYSAVTLFAVGLGGAFLATIAAGNVLKLYDLAGAELVGQVFLSDWAGDFAAIMTVVPIAAIVHAYLSDHARSRSAELVLEYWNSTQLPLLFSNIAIISVSAVFPDSSGLNSHIMFITLIPIILVGLTFGVANGLVACVITTVGLIAIPILTGTELFSATEIQVFLAVGASIAVITGGVRSDKAIALDQAQRANESKSRFLASASHDLRQPLQSATLYMDVSRDLGNDPKQIEIIDKSLNSLSATTEILNALLDVSKLDAGVVTRNDADVPIQDVFERIGDIDPIAQQKGLRFKIVDSPAVLRSDPILVETIIRNLANNAVRYTERGGILVGARSSANNVRIEVWDTGPGIPSDMHDAIFDEFVQVGNSHRDREQGLGLGLSIVRRLIDLLDGELAVRSRVGRGTVMSVTLPRADVRQ